MGAMHGATALLAALLFGLGLGAACGPSVQSIHEGNVRFEHCYRLDLELDRYRLLRDRAQSFEYLGAVGFRPFTLQHGPEDVESVGGALLTPARP